MTIPSAATCPATAPCRLGARDAIDTWDGQREAILRELAPHDETQEIPPGALIGEGLRKIAAGVYPLITRQATDADNRDTLTPETASNGRNAEPEGAWWGTSAVKGWWDSSVGTVGGWPSSVVESVRNALSHAREPPPPPPPEPTPTPKVRT